jgi:hypothetical protein
MMCHLYGDVALTWHDDGTGLTWCNGRLPRGSGKMPNDNP